MSSKARKMADKVQEQQMAETVSREYRIDVRLDELERSTYMAVTGIPKDLPPEYDVTIVRAAKRQFAEALSTRKFLEFYPLGKSDKDEEPVFYNMAKVGSVCVTDVVDVTVR